jgi:hypothetical protein
MERGRYNNPGYLGLIWEIMRINFDKIICINLEALNTQQLFAICETYLIGFEEMYKRKTETKVSKYWVVDNKIVAYVIEGFFFMGTDYKSTSLEEQTRLKKMTPIKTPKMPKTEQALNNYKAFLEEGYDIRTPSMDSKLLYFETKREETRQVKNKEVKIELSVVLETDAILDKIGKYGIDSITIEERNFLDNI